MVVYITEDGPDYKPYKVEVNKKQKTFTVLKNIASKENQYTDEYTKAIIVDEPYIKLFVGRNAYSMDDTYGLGNTLLFCIDESKHTYISVGRQVYAFEAPEKIVKYLSPINDSNLQSYPFAFSKQYCYFMDYFVYLPIKYTDSRGNKFDFRSTDPHAGEAFPYNSKDKKKVTFPHEILDKR